MFIQIGCRDPKKRRVKPVQRHLLQLDFGGLSDSEDDSDFEVPNEKGIVNIQCTYYVVY